MYKKLSKNKLTAAFQKRYMQRAIRCQDGFDGYVYLTDAMHEAVAPSAPYIVVEGIADPSTFPARTHDILNLTPPRVPDSVSILNHSFLLN